MTTIAVAAADAAARAAWVRQVASLGYQVVAMPLRSPPPAPPVDLWVVMLDVATPPLSLAFWLRQIRGRIVLVTPHLHAGQALAALVSALCLVCTPERAASGLADLLALATTIHSGMIALTMPTQEAQWAR